MSENCHCPEARVLQLEDYIHNELCAEDAADIRAHIASCPECRNEHKVGLVLTQVIARSCAESAPDELRAQILANLRNIQSGHAGGSSVEASDVEAGGRSFA